MIPGNASAAFTPNLPSSDAKALSLFQSHSFTPFSSLGAPTATTTIKQCFNQNTDSHSDSHEYGSNHNALHTKQLLIFSANEVSLSNTLTIVSLKLVIWFTSLPLTLFWLEYFTIVFWGMANLCPLIFLRSNCTMGMRLIMYNNYHKNFWISSEIA